MYAMQQTSIVMLLKYFCAYSLTGYFRGLNHSLQRMRGEEQTDNFLLDLLIFLTLLIKLDGGIHGPIEDEVEGEAESEDEGEFKKEVCESACECSPCLDKKATSESLPEAATETLVSEVVATETLVSEVVASDTVPEVVATETLLSEVVASETVPEVTSQQPKIVVKAGRVADKRKGRCVIS